MTEYKVMAKAKHGKKFVCYGHHTDPAFAENSAKGLAGHGWTASVKVIVKDSNGITNELIYK